MDSLNQHEIMGRWDEIIDSGGKCSDTEYAFLKKMIAASLSQKLGVDQIRNPLSLVNLTPELSDPVGLSGTQLDYVNGIKQYCQAHAHFDDTIGQQKSLAKGAQEQEEITEKEKAMNKENLELQLQVARLQKEHNQRQIVLKYLRELGKLPAALPDFLDPEALYENCSPMPEMPKQMIQGFATDHSATDAQAEELLQNLKKHVLRSKLVAQKQQVDYERSQAEKPFDFANMSPEAKLHALNAVKDGLINWVETQLVKAGDDGAGSDTEDKATERGADHDHEAMMAGIQQKYQRHLELRQQIINELAQLDHIKDGITTAAEKSLQQLQTKGSPQEPPNPAYTPEAYCKQIPNNLWPFWHPFELFTYTSCFNTSESQD